jgi:hypothetical protein
MVQAIANWRKLFIQKSPCALALDLATAGRSIARMKPMTTSTTSNSVRENPPVGLRRVREPHIVARASPFIAAALTCYRST